DEERGDGARHHRHQTAKKNGADDLVPLQRIHAENPVEKPGPLRAAAECNDCRAGCPTPESTEFPSIPTTLAAIICAAQAPNRKRGGFTPTRSGNMPRRRFHTAR